MKNGQAAHSEPTHPAGLEEVESFRFPTFFTAVVDYFAIGEGRTIALIMGYAHSAAELRTVVLDHFNPYFAPGAGIWPNLGVAPEHESLVPEAVRKIIADPTKVIGNFHYASLWHLNQS